MGSSKTFLFLGDCNTLGPGKLEGHAYPEKLSKLAHVPVLNCGHTMSTTREALRYLDHQYIQNPNKQNFSLVCVQYGLVDAWETFKYSPYVLYYPDSRWRKLARKLTKKYKKWCRKLGLNQLIGTRNVVPIDEYISNIRQIVKQVHCPVILIETIPNKDTSRNLSIQKYNAALAEIANTTEHCYLLAIYNDFESALADAYIDSTHMSDQGHTYVADKLSKLIQNL